VTFDSQRQRVIDSIRDCQHWVWLDDRLQDDGICGTDGIFCSACQWKIQFFGITKVELDEAGVQEKVFCKSCGTKLIIHFGKAICPQCEHIEIEKKHDESVEEPVMVLVSSPELIAVDVVHNTIEDEPEIHNSPNREGKVFVRCLGFECGNKFDLDVDSEGLVIDKPCPKCGCESYQTIDDVKAFM
jgi:uncharacterized Zn finger protein (UPF0148 family)